MAYAIKLQGKTTLLVADSENLEPKLYDHIRRCIGDVAVLFIGMECDGAPPQQVYVYAMGQEPWLTWLTSFQYTPDSRPIVESGRLVEECRRRGLVSEKLFGRKEIFK